MIGVSGMMFDAGKFKASSKSGAGGKRGKISQWSPASRRRLREYLFYHDKPVGWRSYGVTLTVPGPDREDVLQGWKELSRCFLECIKNNGMGAVWRVELQTRGMPHLHLILIKDPLKPLPGCGGLDDRKAVEMWMFRKWSHYLDKHCPLSSRWVASRPDLLADLESAGIEKKKALLYTTDNPVDAGETVLKRFELPGADRYAVHVDENDGSGSWERYLFDHVSKSKQEQVAVDIGRHWGVTGRKVFLYCEPVEAGLTPAQSWAVIRWCRRLCQGKNKRYRPTFGRRGMGRSIRPIHPETRARMINHVQILIDK